MLHDAERIEKKLNLFCRCRARSHWISPVMLLLEKDIRKIGARDFQALSPNLMFSNNLESYEIL